MYVATPTNFVSAVSRELRSARQLGQHLDLSRLRTGLAGHLSERRAETCVRCGVSRSINAKGSFNWSANATGRSHPSPTITTAGSVTRSSKPSQARNAEKKVWYLFIMRRFRSNPHDPEPGELHEFQAAYRRRVQTDAHLFHSLTSREGWRPGVLKLRDDLTKLRRGVKAIGAGSCHPLASVWRWVSGSPRAARDNAGNARNQEGVDGDGFGHGQTSTRPPRNIRRWKPRLSIPKRRGARCLARAGLQGTQQEDWRRRQAFAERACFRFSASRGGSALRRTLSSTPTFLLSSL